MFHDFSQYLPARLLKKKMLYWNLLAVTHHRHSLKAKNHDILCKARSGFNPFRPLHV